MMSSTDVLLIMIEEEAWGYLNDWEEDQLRKKRTKICMCCDHFRYACTVQCVTLLTCPVHQKLIPQGDHLIKGCKYWVKRRELREGWCPEVAWKQVNSLYCYVFLSYDNFWISVKRRCCFCIWIRGIPKDDYFKNSIFWYDSYYLWGSLMIHYIL